MYNDITQKILVENLPGYAYVKNLKSEYIFCNKNLAEVAGFQSIEDIIGKTDAELIWGKEFGDAFKEDDLYVINSGQSEITEHYISVKVDSVIKKIYVKTEKIPLRNDKGKIIAILAVAMDITDVKNAQDSKSIFISQVSHEIKNPLSNSLMAIQSIRDLFNISSDNRIESKINNDEIEELLNIASDETNKSIDSLNNLIRLHEVQIGNIKPSYQITDLVELINHVYEQIALNKKNKIRLVIKAETKKFIKCNIDFNNFSEAIKYILLNAYRHSNIDEQIIVSIRNSQLGSKYFIQVEIKDTGCGMSPNVLKSINDTLVDCIDYDGTKMAGFYKRKYSKPALKFALSKNLLQISGCLLEVQSAENIGTLVRISIPNFQDKNNLLLLNKYDKVQKKILIVDDDLRALNYIYDELRKFNFNCFKTQKASDALKISTLENFDFIILDITLDDGNGIDLMTSIKNANTYPSFFIAVTSHSSQDSIDYLSDKGFINVFSKPISIHALHVCINDLIKTINENDS